MSTRKPRRDHERQEGQLRVLQFSCGCVVRGARVEIGPGAERNTTDFVHACRIGRRKDGAELSPAASAHRAEVLERFHTYERRAP